ncbi:MAG: hypothetical protein L0Z68_10345 [Gammaproteobacteria bacterium]|nr:hypothetical protein [Gammaproteobacteria bacterium]
MNLPPIVATWSDEVGLVQAMALAEKFRYLLPRRITNAQLSGLNGVVQTAPDLGKVIDFTKHQGKRAESAGRLDVAGYWEELQKAFQRLQEEAAGLAVKAGLIVEVSTGKKSFHPGAPASLSLWLAQEFTQHLVVHSLYLGAVDRGSDKPERAQ